MSDLNVDSINVLSALDKLMSQHKTNPILFCKVFEKKKLIIDLIKSRKLDGKMYKGIIAKCMKSDNEFVKTCAVSDAMKLKDAKDQTMIIRWFEEMINATGEPYQLQEKLYAKYHSAEKPQAQVQKPPPAQPQKSQKEFKQVDATQIQQIKVQPKKPASQVSGATGSLIGGISSEEIVSFKVADNLLEKNEENKQFYERFLQRKKKLLELVNNKLVNAEKYKANIVYAQSRIKKQCMPYLSEQMLSDMKFELDAIEDFHDGNVEVWFKDVISETKDNLKEQQQHLVDLTKGKSIKKTSKQISLEVQAESDIKQSEPIDLKEAITFKVIEEQLQNNDDNKLNYKILLEKKKNLLDLYKKGALTADKYKALVSKSISQVKNSQVKESMTMELSQIDDLHDGNVQEWFKDVINNAEMFLEDQIKKLADLQKGAAPQKSKHDKLSDQELDISDEEQVKQEKPPVPSGKGNQPQSASQSGKVLIDFKELYSLKAIDEYLQQYEKNSQIYCLCFERKLQIFQMMKNGEITPQKYKSLQQKTFKNTQNEKLRDVVEMDLVDLKDICDNNVNEWFEGVINDTGMNFQDQQALYKKRAGKGSSATQAKKGSSIDEANKKVESALKIAEKPVINDVACFTAIIKLFIYAAQRVDIIYYKQKLIELIALKKLVPAAYRKINQAAASKTDNKFLKDTILEEQARLKGQFKGNEQSWFESLVGVLKSPPPELVLPENKEMKRINAGSSPKKIQYFLRSMAAFECLFYYYKKNKIPVQSNKYLEQYQKKKRKEVIHCLELIQKDPKFDVYNLTQQIFPQINNDIFYGDSLPALKQKAQSYIPLITKEIAALKDYISKIKKATNTQNINNVKKQIAKCEENIICLKSWPSGSMTPLPIITEQKIEKYNLDINSKLDKNQIEVIITSLAGLTSELTMNVYVVDHNKERISVKANNGPINAKFVAKLNEKEMFEVCKGDKRHIFIKFFKRGFFGGLSLIFEGSIETIFARNNIIEEKAMIGEVQVSYVLKVNKPTKPLITEIIHYEVTQLPKYKHDKFVEDEIIKKYSMYSSPTPSEIIVVDT